MAGLSDFTKSSLVGGVVGAADSAIGAALGLLAQKKQFNYNKKMFNLQNQRQDYLMQNEDAIKKSSLQRAGYSTADPNGTGVSAPAVASAGSAGIADYGSGPVKSGLQAAMFKAQLDNLESQTAKNNAEAENTNVNTYLLDTYGDQQWQSAIANLDASTQERIATALYNDQQRLNSIQLTEAQVKDINDRLSMDWMKLGPSLRLIVAQAFEAEQSGALKKAQISQVWQDIRESAQRIEKMKSDMQVNDAQIAVLTQQVQNMIAEEDLTKQDKRLKGQQTLYYLGLQQSTRFAAEVQRSMGVGYYQAINVRDAILPFAAAGALLSKLSPAATTTNTFVVPN